MEYVSKKVSAPSHILQALSEQCKRNLSIDDKCEMNILPKVGTRSERLTVLRTEFEELNTKLFNKIIEPIDAVLSFANITEDEVNEIILVGGSSRIPRIRQIVRDRFKRSELNYHLDPDTTIVYGLAIQAGITGRMWPIRVSATEVKLSVAKLDL